jgi:hypothetical protein
MLNMNIMARSEHHVVDVARGGGREEEKEKEEDKELTSIDERRYYGCSLRGFLHLTSGTRRVINGAVSSATETMHQLPRPKRAKNYSSLTRDRWPKCWPVAKESKKSDIKARIQRINRGRGGGTTSVPLGS